MIKDADQPGDGDRSTSGREYIMNKDVDKHDQEDVMLKVIPLI